jgi:hypothetical protein
MFLFPFSTIFLGKMLLNLRKRNRRRRSYVPK